MFELTSWQCPHPMWWQVNDPLESHDLELRYPNPSKWLGGSPWSQKNHDFPTKSLPLFMVGHYKCGWATHYIKTLMTPTSWKGESPSLVLDNWWKLSTNLCHQVWSWARLVHTKWWSKWEVHGDEDGHEMMVIKLQLGKEEREKQKPSVDQGKDIKYCFGTQDTIEGVSVFRIDSCTIKRINLWLNGLSSATRRHDFCICI